MVSDGMDWTGAAITVGVALIGALFTAVQATKVQAVKIDRLERDVGDLVRSSRYANTQINRLRLRIERIAAKMDINVIIDNGSDDDEPMAK